MNGAHLKVDKGPVTKVALNRPEARNALSGATLRELAKVFQELARDESLRAVLVTGEGRDFCSGADAQWMREGGKLPPDEAKKDARLFARMLAAVDECPAPVVVAAHGHVFGGGLGLLAAADVALLSDDAKLSFSEARLGLVPSVISSWVLPRIGAANARRYYLTAEVFGAATAVRIGLAHEAVPAAELAARAQFVIDSILKNGPNAVRAAKALIPKVVAAAPAERVTLTVETLARLRATPEAQEGLAAFLEKRPARWTAKP